jgi:hypothetical protein
MNDHEEAAKFMIKSRISFIHANVDKSTVANTANALGRLLADLNGFLNGLPEGK